MSFVQNFPFFSIILSLVCAVVSFAANARWARRLSIFLLSASAVLQGSLLVYCTVHHVRYSYMMGHYPAPWGNELTAGILEPFLAMLFAGVMLLCVLGGMGRILSLTLPAGSSIGLHTHEGNCEIIHVLSGSGVCHDDGQDVALRAGMTHYCPEGHSHGIDNDGAEPLVLLAVLPELR